VTELLVIQNGLDCRVVEWKSLLQSMNDCELYRRTSLTGAGIAAVCLRKANWWQKNRITLYVINQTLTMH
jgi:hypothetical protein